MEPHNHLTSPPDWSLAVGYAGRTFVLLAIVLLVFAAIGWLLVPRNENLRKYAARSFTFGCLSLFGAFFSLATLFIAGRFEFVYVGDHGDSQNAIPYRIAGIWAGQEGSFLLWACCAALFGILAVRGTGIYRRWFTVAYAGFLSAIAGILAYETPFGLMTSGGKPFVPADGVGLSPALQNYWVTIHPPVIFMGFGALTVLAAYGFAALVTNKLHDWVPMVRPWSILALTLTGVGLCMGGFWAYETLGWGGFWMWDPVENVSFVPWVLTGALVHGLMVQVTKKKWVLPNLLMAGLPFFAFGYGTFLTRSGLLSDTSVHSFANMNNTALKLLGGFLLLSALTFFALMIKRSIEYKRSVKAEPVEEQGPRGWHREGFFRFGAWLLAGLGVGAALGMSWPAFMVLAGKSAKVVEEPLYHSTLSWLYVPLMLAMAAAPMVAWRGMKTREFANRLFGVICVSVAVVGAIMMAAARSPWVRREADDYIKLPFGIHAGALMWVLILTSLSVFVIVANLWRISELIKRSKLSAAAFLMHVGVAVLMAGLITSRGLEKKDRFDVQEGSHAVGLGSYFVSYDKMTSDTYDRENKVLFNIVRGNEKWTASPGLYYVQGPEGPRPMVWPDIHSTPFYDIYFALQPPTNELSGAVTLQKGVPTVINGESVTFEDLVREGEPGAEGTTWGAKLKIGTGKNAVTVVPKMELAKHDVIDHSAEITPDVRISMLSMNAGSNSVTVQLLTSRMRYPIEMFYKPLTILVWLGTGIMAFAGLLSAFYRRMPRAKKAVVSAEPDAEPQKELVRAGRKVAAVRTVVR